MTKVEAECIKSKLYQAIKEKNLEEVEVCSKQLGIDDEQKKYFENGLTGFPSFDKPWLKYYSSVAKNTELPKCSLYEYLYQNNKDNKNAYALNYFGKRMTYGELFEKIDIASKAFVGMGVKAGDIVTIVSVSNVVSIICLYAINNIGAIANYVNVLADEQDMREYFKEAASEVVVTLDLFGEKVINAAEHTDVKTIISFSLSEFMPMGTAIGYKIKTRKIDLSFKNNRRVIEWKQFIKHSAGITKYKAEKNPEKPCLLGHTGGTTGFPKGVFLSDNAMNAVAHQYNVTMDHKLGETFLNCIIPFVVYGILTCLHMPLCLGLEIIVVPKFEAADWKKYLTKNKPVHIAGIPSYVVPMLTDPSLNGVDMSFIKTLAVGGDGLNDNLEMQVNEFLEKHGVNVRMTKGYGMTEVCATAVTEYSFCNHVGSVGIPMVKNNIMIYDNDAEMELTYNVVGEVCINSPSLLIEYQNNEEEFKNLVKLHQDGRKWVHTGDLGYITEEGLLFISGRMKRMIFLGPEGMLYKVFPRNIEDVINTIDGISDCCIVSKEGEGKLSALAYLIVSNSGVDHALLEKQIKEECKDKMPQYMIPEEFVYMDAFPLTSIGKTDFKKLESMANS